MHYFSRAKYLKYNFYYFRYTKLQSNKYHVYIKYILYFLSLRINNSYSSEISAKDFDHLVFRI